MKSNQNKVAKPSTPVYTKYGMDFSVACGTYTCNPEQLRIFPQGKYRKYIWLWFDGYWYLTNIHIGITRGEEEPINNVINLLKSSYNRERFLEQLTDLIA